MAKPEHPANETVALWVLDPASDAVGEVARRHLESGCDVCAERVGRFRRVVADVERAARTAVPAGVVMRAHRALELETAVDVEVLVARLLEDTAVLEGVRGEATEERFLLFRAGAWDLHFRIAPRDGERNARILGHVDGPEDASYDDLEVRVLHEDRVVANASLDDLGEFALEARLLSPLFLEIQGPRLVIRTPPVH